MNLKLLINEELNELFFNEVKEYAADEIINKDDINLQHEYDKLNQQLFNNQLPKVPLKWSNRKTSLGHVNVTINRREGKNRINYLAMSAFYSTTYQQFKNTLAHEMIHVKTYSEGKLDFSGKHGYYFHVEANRINGINIGYKITDFNTEKVEVSNSVKENMKTLIAIILEIDGNYNVTVTTPNVFNAESELIFSLYERIVNVGKYGNVEITVIESRNSQLIHFPVQRTYKRAVRYSKLSDELLEELLNDKIIKSVKLKRGAPRVVSEENEPANNGDWITFDIV